MALHSWSKVLAGLAVACTAVLSCAPPSGSQPQTQQAEPTTQQHKRIVAAVGAPPPVLHGQAMASVGGTIGADAVTELVSAGMANMDNVRQLQPELAEAVPSLENGLWKVAAD